MNIDLNAIGNSDEPNRPLSAELERCRHELEECRKRMEEMGRAEKLLEGEKRLLEKVSKGEALAPILDELCRLGEEQCGEVFVSILFVNPDGKTLRHGSAPSLPKTYTDAIDGALIGPCTGSCGTSAYRKEMVVVADIATDPLWVDYRQHALSHGLRACWSNPIFSSTREVLGTFALYASQPGVPTREQQNAVEQFAHFASIMIERTRSQEALRRSEAYLEEAQRLSRTGSFGWNVATGELVWSDETFRILGYDRAIKPVMDLVLTRVHPEDLAFVQHTIEQATRDEADSDFEHRLLLPDGRIKHVRVMARASRSRAGVVEFVGAVMDITDRKNSQEALRAAKARFEGILEIADDAIISVDSNHRIVLFNQGAEKVFGYEAAELIGRPLETLLPKPFLQPNLEHLETSANSRELSSSVGQRRAVFGRRKDGSEFPAEASISKLVLGEDFVFTIILRDVTEQRRLENSLRQSERNLAEGQRLTKTGSWILDFQTGETDWSVETCRIFGFPDPPPSPHYREFRERVHPADREAVDRGLRESFETGEPRPLQYVFILPDGVCKHIETMSQPVRDETGAVVRLMGTVMDVTERKQAEDAIRASEKLARGQTEALTGALDALARDSSPDHIVEQVLRTFTTQLNAHSSSVWLRNEASGLMVFEFSMEDGKFRTKANSEVARISPAFGINDVWPWPEVFRTGKPYLVEDIREGTEFPWRAHVLAQGVVSILMVPMLINRMVKGVIGIRFTEKRAFRREETDLAQALTNQVMLAMELLRLSEQSREAAVIAERNRMARDIHDTLAQGFTGVIVQLEAAQDAASKGLTEEACKHVSRAGEMARYGLSEARRSVQALRIQDLKDTDFCSAMDAHFRRLTAGTCLKSEFVLRGVPASLPPEWEDNLLRIAQEVVTNALRHAHATHLKTRLQFNPQMLRLELRDNGRGFNPELRNDGFGLMGMRERVQQMGGDIAIQSAEGAGTSILITLPLTDTVLSQQP